MASVDLPAVARLTGIPHGTLRRWAMEWAEQGRDGRRKLYDWNTVEEAVRVRQERAA